jgi:hypothetical protein
MVSRNIKRSVMGKRGFNWLKASLPGPAIIAFTVGVVILEAYIDDYKSKSNRRTSARS